MFRCELCSSVVPPRTHPKLLVIARRTKQYAVRSEVNLVLREGKKHYTNDPGGVGRETVREVRVCPDCAVQHTGT